MVVFCKAPLIYPVHQPKPLATAASSEDATEVTKQTLTEETSEPMGSSEGCEKRWLMVTNCQKCLAKPSFMYASYFKNIIFGDLLIMKIQKSAAVTFRCGTVQPNPLETADKVEDSMCR